MIIKKVTSVYFSPNGTTKEIVNKVAKGMGDYEIQEIDLTSVESRNIKRNFEKDELLIFGLPVYSDRLPGLSNDIFENIKGNNTPAIAIVSYGNREYGDALLELKDNLIEADMRVISGAAIVAEHCLNKNIATSRPDERDDLKIADYANRIKEKIKNIQTIETLEDIHVKGNYPYHPIKANQIPTGDDKCIECGLCKTNCPVNAIRESNYRLTDSDLCIGCGSCINVCPTGARAIRNEGFIHFIKKLEEIAKERKEIEFFI
ncbi:MAG: EFR1 family ferrodoxin [Bacteroidales bacterium]|nr:EFR1 family ferrodoxin [Bacteroidales bacterium]